MEQMDQREQAGYSVLEALVALTLFIIVMAAAMSIYAPSRQLYTRGERQTDIQQNARLAMGEMTRQIRMAGYFPENLTTPPPPLGLDNRILAATNVALVIHGDVDGSGASNAFMYCLTGNSVRRKRGAADDAASFTCTGGDVLAENVTGLHFTYYDTNGDPVPDPLTSNYQLDNQGMGAVPDMSVVTQREVVRRVVIRVTLETETLVNQTEGYQLISDVFLRNAG